MSEDDLNRAIDQQDIDMGDGDIPCYGCDESITVAGGGWWVLMRPNTAYPFCNACMRGEQDAQREEADRAAD